MKVLADALGLPLTPSLQLVEAPQGTNFAVAGAAGLLPDGGVDDNNLDVQLAAFDFEVGQAAPADLENALYVVFIGGNDIRAARDAFSQGLAKRVVHTAVEKVDAAVRHLAARGARAILVVNAPDIGVIPESRLLAQSTHYPAPKILSHLSLPIRAPPRSPRLPPRPSDYALALCLALTWVRLYLPFSRPHAPRDPRYPFPWWGWIVVANALSLRRTGKCLLTHEPRYLIMLFPLSAVFWWYFEYLNRFVQNWHYVNHAATTPLAYIGHATLAFSTVLPAFTSTLELLRSYRTLATTRFRKPLSLTRPKFVAAVVLILASVALLGIAIRPDYLYPLVWIPTSGYQPEGQAKHPRLPD